MIRLFSFSIPIQKAPPRIALPQQQQEPSPPPPPDLEHVPLDRVVRPMLTTAEAAYYLNRKPQTLRMWACKEEGPIRPLRLNGRLGWPVSELRRYLRVEQGQATR